MAIKYGCIEDPRVFSNSMHFSQERSPDARTETHSSNCSLAMRTLAKPLRHMAMWLKPGTASTIPNEICSTRRLHQAYWQISRLGSTLQSTLHCRAKRGLAYAISTRMVMDLVPYHCGTANTSWAYRTSKRRTSRL